LKKILNLLHPKKTKSFSSLFLLIFSLFLQALIIPILPLPGKIVLDRLQFINNENLLALLFLKLLKACHLQESISN